MTAGLGTDEGGRLLDQDQTQIVTTSHRLEAALDDRVHCLELVDGVGAGRRHIIGPAGVTVGRTSPADLVLTDSEVSRSHCRLALEGEDLMVTDLNSTNGTFVEGVRVIEPTILPVGSMLKVGRLRLKHEWRTRRDILHADEFDRDLEKASSYVQALLPSPLRDGPIRADWLYEPCAKLGGDAFGYGALSDRLFVAYLIDVSGHGAGAAMHSVAVMNLLRQRALPNTDMSKPAEVLATLNTLFQMDRHDGMYFTIWYGVYDAVTRRLDFASGGHHASYLMPADRGEAIAMRTRGAMIGADPETIYRTDGLTLPPGASVYLFSDGVFEIVTIDGIQWGLRDFLPLILDPPVDGLSECKRLFRAVQGAARPGGFDDDFSLVVLTFD
jgi:serine phosphatase RsbU (regulator of sigma subunit)